MIQYSGDYDETLVAPWYGAHADQSNAGGIYAYKWMDAIYPYIKSEQIFDCPSNTRNRVQGYRYIAEGSPAIANVDEEYGSYSINSVYMPDSLSAAVRPPVSSNTTGNWTRLTRQSLLQSPSTTFWVGENNVGTVSPTIVNSISGTNYQYRMFTERVSPPRLDPTYHSDILWGYQNGATASVGWNERHLDTTNVLFCDGHVKAMKIENMLLNRSGNQCGAFPNVCSGFSIEDD